MYLSMFDQEQHSNEVIEIRSKEIDDLKLRLFEMKEMLENVQQETSQQIEEINDSARRTIEEKESEVYRVRGEAALVKETSEKELDQMRLLVKESQESKEQSSRLVALAQEAAESAKLKAEANEAMAQKDYGAG